MGTKLERINKRIKSTWRWFIFFGIFIAAIVGVTLYLDHLKEERYLEEYNSTTWREVEAVLDHNYRHVERKSHTEWNAADDEYEDVYENVEYYDWYFTYQGKDEKSYTYVKKDNLHAAMEQYTTTIYVDENDDSHSLEIKNLDYSKKANGIVTSMIVILFIPYIMLFGIFLTMLYIQRFLASDN